MARNRDRLIDRNLKIRQFVSSQERQFPDKKFGSILRDAADGFCLEESTVEAIIKRKGIYKDI